ncbi:amidohydrolase family protein [Nocardia sp. alder85J]|uniref:amidohydrolase family protein n=1 Tax=Nocardia sp. alder85J TaxID=2862949 RepID=UPI001CD562AD|nr:amidohydrolase family protein [Nocardia sp. alder85J]MCX4098442.1 amidohydrolase family protein [Nocardia sp. alder85J]
MITDIAVVDTRDGTRTPHQDVRIDNGRIAAIGATTGTVDPGQVDGSGRFLVPGYADMHSHVLGLPDPADALALMLSFGITGYRQMAGTRDLLRRRNSGEFDAPDRPRLLALAGDLLTPFNAGSPAAAVAEVAAQAAAGADFVKAVMISPDVYFAAQREADRHDIAVLGHLPAGIDVRAASRAGFRSIEHLGPGPGVLAGCSHHEHQLVANDHGRSIPVPPFTIPFMDRLAGRMLATLVVNPSQLTTPGQLHAMRDALDSFDEDKCRELAREFVANDTWNCPTLIRVQTQELCGSPEFAGDPDLRYIAPRVRRTWAKAATAFTRKFSTAQHEIFAAQFERQLTLVRLFHDEGVPLLAGSDAVGAAWVIPGSALHREFDLLSRAGLPPLSVLQAATSGPARFLGRENSSGSVDVGKDADLVLLSADPLADTANLHTVTGVVRAGTYHSAADLAALRDRIAVRGIG